MSAFYLILPKLHKTRITAHTLKSSESAISIPTSEQFYKVWENGPKDPQDINELATQVVQLCATFGELAKFSQGKVKVSQKSNPRDLVTEVDKGIEMLFRVWLKRHHPTHKIVGEEGHKAAFSQEDIVWYLDPIDGTSNFVDGLSDVSMLMGCFKNGKPLLSVIGLPITNEIYLATPSQVAYIRTQNGDPLSSTAFLPPSLNPKGLLGTEYMESRLSEQRLFKQLQTELHLSGHRVRSIGLNLLDILRGKSSYFYKPGIKAWDMMGPVALLKLAFGESLDARLLTPYPNASTTFHANASSTHVLFGTTSLTPWINAQIQTNCRLGLLIIGPANAKIVLETIIQTLDNHVKIA